MIKLNTQFIIVLTIMTIIIWIGYETYSTLTRETRKIKVRNELLIELTKTDNEEVVNDLKGRVAY